MKSQLKIQEITTFAKQLLKQGDITAGAIGLTIAAIVVIGVGIPIVLQVIANQTLTGTTALIVGFVPVFMALALLVGAVSLMRT